MIYRIPHVWKDPYPIISMGSRFEKKDFHEPMDFHGKMPNGYKTISMNPWLKKSIKTRSKMNLPMDFPTTKTR